MSNLTKQAIKASFLKLLNDRPLSRISVKEIVEDCGINRNSFYYHYQDIPTLIEEIIMEIFSSLLEKYPSYASIDELFLSIVTYSLENKRAVLHIYHSLKRDIFEESLLKYCNYMVTTYIDTVFQEQKMDPADRKMVIHFVKCQLFGAYLDWLNRGMPDENYDEFRRMLVLCQDLPDEIIRRSRDQRTK